MADDTCANCGQPCHVETFEGHEFIIDETGGDVCGVEGDNAAHVFAENDTANEMVLIRRKHLETLFQFAGRGAEDLVEAASHKDNGYDPDEVEQQLEELAEAMTYAQTAPPGRLDEEPFFVFVQYEDTEPDRLFRPTLEAAWSTAKGVVESDAEFKNVTRITINGELFYDRDWTPPNMITPYECASCAEFKALGLHAKHVASGHLRVTR